MVVVAGASFAVGFAMLGLAWAGGNPPAASPDEDSHVVKAYATGQLDISGEAYQADLSGETARTVNWFHDVGRSYFIPAALVPTDSVHCFAFDSDRTADCQDLDSRAQDPEAEVLAPTHFGTYSPILYFPIGIAMSDAVDYRAAEWRGRLVVLALNAGFITWSALLLARRGTGWLPLAGLALAVTPTVLFLSSNVGVSGIEITAAICFWSALLRLSREPENSAGGPWAAAAVSGAAMALSRPISALLIVVILASIVLLSGVRAVAVTTRAARSKALAASAVGGLAVGASFLWSALVTPQPPFDGELAMQALREWPGDASRQIQQAVGVFGWNDTSMPGPVYLWALVVLGAAFAAAFVVGRRRERIVLVGVVAAAVACHIGLTVLIPFWMQARYVLPIAVGVPLVAAELLETHRSRVRQTWVRLGVVVSFVTAGLMHFTAFTVNAHRYAVGRDASWGLPWDSRWAPDGGWGPWFALAAVGALLLMAPALLVRTRRDELAEGTLASVSSQREERLHRRVVPG